MNDNSRFGARFLAELIFVFHSLLMLFLLTGWLLQPPYYYLYVAALWATFITQVALRYCVLTIWEFHFRRVLDPSIGESPYYLTYYTHKAFPGLVSDRFVNWISYVFLLVSILVSLLRLWGFF
jgi:Protein of Unknown function (DUF2784)